MPGEVLPAQITHSVSYDFNIIQENRVSGLFSLNLENIVMQIILSTLNLSNFISNGDKSVTKPVQLGLQLKSDPKLEGLTTKDTGIMLSQQKMDPKTRK